MFAMFPTVKLYTYLVIHFPHLFYIVSLFSSLTHPHQHASILFSHLKNQNLNQKNTPLSGLALPISYYTDSSSLCNRAPGRGGLYSVYSILLISHKSTITRPSHPLFHQNCSCEGHR